MPKQKTAVSTRTVSGAKLAVALAFLGAASLAAAGVSRLNPPDNAVRQAVRHDTRQHLSWKQVSTLSNTVNWCPAFVNKGTCLSTSCSGTEACVPTEMFISCAGGTCEYNKLYVSFECVESPAPEDVVMSSKELAQYGYMKSSCSS